MKMKKIIISIFSLLLVIGVSNINACETCGCKGNNQEVKKEKECPFTKNEEGKVVCIKTGKVCDKDTKDCCKSDKKSTATKCSTSKKGAFDYGSTNDYSSKKSSCSKKAKKECNKEAKKKGCCSKKGGEKKGCSKKTETKE